MSAEVIQHDGQQEQHDAQQEHTYPFDGLDLLCIFFAAAMPWFIPIALVQYVVRRSETVRRDMEDLALWARGQNLLPSSEQAGDHAELHHQVGAAAPASVPSSALELLPLLGGALHLLVIGHTRGGKTSLIHALAQRWAAQHAVLVCDPDAAPGLWPGCRVHGAGDDFESIGRALGQVQSLIAKRRQQRAAGQRVFKPFYVILDEAQDILREVDAAPPVFATLLRRGGKIGMHLVVGVQDRQKATLQIEGQTHLLINFEYTAHVRQLEDGRRIADVESAERTQRLPIPELPELESFIAPGSQAPDDLLSELLAGAVPGATKGGTGSQAAVPVSGGGTGTGGDTGAYNTLGTGISDEEIRRRIAAGETRNQVADLLPGRKQQRLERIRRALAAGDDPPGAFKFLGE